MRHGTHTGHALMPLMLLTASGTGQLGFAKKPVKFVPVD